MEINAQWLSKFERGLNLRHLEKSAIPARVLGYGEISTVLEAKTEDGKTYALKRMPMFNSPQEAEAYQKLYRESVSVFTEKVGLQLVPGELIMVSQDDSNRIVGYIIQEKLPANSIGNQVIHRFPDDQVLDLCDAVLQKIKLVFGFNEKNKGKLEIGFDAQISNWAFAGIDEYQQKGKDAPEIFYFDTSSPLLRKNGQEQLDPELFLRSAPSFLVWIIRLLFLKDVLTRYYDLRLVLIDLVANFYKEQRADLIPELTGRVNNFLEKDFSDLKIKPITEKEVKSYYREDALIWRIYLAFRKVDRFLHRLVGKKYHYILPDKIQR
ncbi:MAG: hypothetical protein GXO74_00445 [Calditrichaeota bacterium]|nr:hypothetical protein [Calditrichota bacterium]